MALHPEFPTSPYAPLIPEQRWFPADLLLERARLKLRCADATAAEEDERRYDFVLVDQAGVETHTPRTFAALAASFKSKS
jgi:hypothetical protein